jgi:ribosome-associated translation inhibitor RaiA
MRFSHFFIDRPIFAAVLSILLTIAGAIAQRSLPISEYPEIAPPTVNISASYPGASAEVIAATVATPIEQEVNGVDDMLYITSQSTGDGRVSIDVVFKAGVNVDQAQVLVQNRVSIAEPRLPEDVRRLGVTVRKASPDLMMVVHLTSPDGSRDQQYISNYATLYLKGATLRARGASSDFKRSINLVNDELGPQVTRHREKRRRRRELHLLLGVCRQQDCGRPMDRVPRGRVGAVRGAGIRNGTWNHRHRDEQFLSGIGRGAVW